MTIPTPMPLPIHLQLTIDIYLHSNLEAGENARNLNRDCVKNDCGLTTIQDWRMKNEARTKWIRWTFFPVQAVILHYILWMHTFFIQGFQLYKVHCTSTCKRFNRFTLFSTCWLITCKSKIQNPMFKTCGSYKIFGILFYFIFYFLFTLFYVEKCVMCEKFIYPINTDSRFKIQDSRKYCNLQSLCILHMHAYSCLHCNYYKYSLGRGKNYAEKKRWEKNGWHTGIRNPEYKIQNTRTLLFNKLQNLSVNSANCKLICFSGCAKAESGEIKLIGRNTRQEYQNI